MKLQIELELDNPAFADPDEVGRILEDIASRLPQPLCRTNELSLHDSHETWVGYARIIRGQINSR